MRFKLDENLPIELADLLRRSGHDVATVSIKGSVAPEIPNLHPSAMRKSAFS